MANELYISLQPYIEIDNIYREEISNECICCGKTYYNSETNFCPKCGKQIILSEHKHNEVIGHYSYIDEENEDNMRLFNDDNKTIITSNYSDVSVDIELDNDEYKTWEITDKVKSEMINKFINTHSKDIAKIEEFIGKKVDIKFGITANWG